MLMYEMNMIFNLVLVIMAAIIYPVEGFPTDLGTTSSPQLLHACGRSLPEYLNMICHSPLYNTEEPTEDLQHIDTSTQSSKQLVQTSNSIPSEKKLKRVPRGVADECCILACTIDTLLQYCP